MDDMVWPLGCYFLSSDLEKDLLVAVVYNVRLSGVQVQTPAGKALRKLPQQSLQVISVGGPDVVVVHVASPVFRRRMVRTWFAGLCRGDALVKVFGHQGTEGNGALGCPLADAIALSNGDAFPANLYCYFSAWRRATHARASQGCPPCSPTMSETCCAKLSWSTESKALRISSFAM